MKKNIIVYKKILINLRNVLLRYKYQVVFLLIMPFWIMYGVYYTYYDETTKNAVIIETEKIVNYIDGEARIEYKNTDKIITFCANVYINRNDIDIINKFDSYLVERGYEKFRENEWSKKKYIIKKEYDVDYVVYNIRYLKNIIQ